MDVRAAAIVGFAITWTATATGQAVNEFLGDGVVRSFASAAAQTNAEASVALVSDPASIGLVPAGFGPLPVFSTPGGVSTVTVPVEVGTNLYATGSQSGPLERTGRRVEYYNLDNFGWGDSSNRNYQTHPWVLGVREDGSAFGVLFDSTWASSLDLEQPLTDGIVFQTEGPMPRVITIDAASPQEVVQRLGELTGYPFMPPMWSVGYHQSKYSYFPQQNVLDVANEFRSRQIPAEVIWMDIDYMDGFRNFTFNGGAFPDPAQLNSDLDAIGFQAVWMANCGIKVDGG
ncbi:MAG: TIM-barrel domain-containing protein, partial [Planctomycetota bacterium]